MKFNLVMILLLTNLNTIIMNTLFPNLIGGTSGDTVIETLDVGNSLDFIIGGYTKDSSLE